MLIVVLASAIATTCVWRGQIDQLASALGTNKHLKINSKTLVPAGFGGTQTILLVGNDQRKHTTTSPVLPHSNEMLLVRIDPDQPWISMMSIPRELQATFRPPHSGSVTTRLNATMQDGGINLTIKTITNITGIKINHVVVVDFDNFRRAINEMGCVYGQIDRRYYHVNVPGGPQYFQVNLHPGYQRLCGNQALQFVTYRHTDTATERDDRDQDFLIQLKQEFGPTLVGNIGKFEKIFGQTVQTDGSLQTESGVSSLVGTLISSAGKPVRQVPWKTHLDTSTICTCDISTPQQVKESVDSFLYGTYIAPNKKATTSLARQLHKKRSGKSKLGVVPVPTAQIAAATRKAHTLSFPLELPQIEVNNGFGFPLDVRRYSIDGLDHKQHPAYVGVFSTGLIGQYYDVQGTSWLNAPILSSPTDSIAVAGRTYYLYYSGSHILQIAWFANNAAYWVRNTIPLSLSNSRMLAIAEHTAPLIGVAAGSVKLDAKHQDAAPASVALPSENGPLYYFGVVGGVIALIASLGGIVVLIGQRLRIGEMREESELAAERVSALEQQLARFSRPAGKAGPVGHGPHAMPNEATLYSGKRRVRRTRTEPST
jgi:polyisoprenyl-teichoic acid--peptidoglycan teichoic acid transferase